MFSLGIRYLMGWAMAAADGAKKERAEWPPHPDRVFMALAAAWFETGQDKAEGEALRWLEGQRAPKLSATGHTQRQVVTHFVPVNDPGLSTAKTIQNLAADDKASLGGLKDAGLSQLPEFRSRQPRAFPVAIPHDPDVHLIWDESNPENHLAALESICRKVSAIGHSASLVQVWVNDAPPVANLVPVSGVAPHRLRIFGPGRLAYLEARCNRDKAIAFADLEEQIKNAKGKDKKMLQERMKTEFPTGRPVSLRPDPGLWQGYAPPIPAVETKPAGGVFDPRLLVLTLSGKRLPLPAALKLTEALRGALLKACPHPIPEWISGHDADGRASHRAHIAILPLPFVGSEHANGRIMGIALALPREIEPAEAARVLEPWLRDADGLPRRLKLFDGQWLECGAELETREQPPQNLRLATWTTPAKRWASVTPVVLDRHFDGPDKWEQAADSIKIACERVGLPRPLEVLLHPVSLIEGVPKSNEFPWITRKRDGGRLHHAHAVIVFDEAVEGPVLVGAGRFRGYGLCRPLHQGGEDHA
ncbi:MAG: type I-G CRISPR-associated protein Csb2 [Pseudomonadota bacterium]